MARPKNDLEKMARDAAARIDRDRAAGVQLSLLVEDTALPAAAGGARAVRGEGKSASQLRKMLAAKGMRMPEDVIAEMAGLASRDDVFTSAWADTERALLAAQDGAVGYKGAPVEPSMRDRLETFKFFYMVRLRAAEALAPYGLAKVTPDAGGSITNNIIMPGAQVPSQPADRAAAARDVTPQARRMAPPPMPHEIQQNQGLGESGLPRSDAAIRTDEVKC